MVTARSYSAAEIIELIQAFRSGGDIPESELAGMDRLGQLLRHFENMSDDDIAAEAQRYFRSVSRSWALDS